MVAPTRSLSTALSDAMSNPGTSSLRRGLLHLQALVYPSHCLICHGKESLRRKMDACNGCLADLPRLGRSCVRCAASLVIDPGAAEVCGRCLSRPPPYSRTWCLGPYEAGLARLITGLKFDRRLENARLLGQLLGQFISAHPHREDLTLIPVPLHPARLRQRGFNQALEIARWASRVSGTRLSRDAVRRRRNTRAQTGLGAAQRKSNLANAFVCRNMPDAERIALIDDVMTTGSTVSSLAMTLRRAGFKKLEVWCCARASLHGQRALQA